MELTIIVDNNTIIDKYLVGEPALSFYIESMSDKILFDTGYSDIFLKNLNNLDIKINDINYIVLSHGHNDHTGGLNNLINHYEQSVSNTKPPILAAHENILYPKIYDNFENVGIQTDKNKINDFFDLKLVKNSFQINESLFFLGEIPRIFEYEANKPIGKIQTGENFIDDYLLDDSALAYNSKDGIIIITGCSHSGICNICEYAKDVLKNNNIISIIGGFHLFKEDKNQISETVNYFKKQKIRTLYPCHCTCLEAKFEFSKYFEVKEVGVGYKISVV